MSSLTYNGGTHVLTLYDSNNREVGHWHANNNVAHTGATMTGVPNGVHQFLDRNSAHTHGGNADMANGSYGTHGILRMTSMTANGTAHSGVGVHAGRANRHGADHPTHGCIRTTEEAMTAITAHIGSDALTTMTVINNGNHGVGALNGAHAAHPRGHQQHTNHGHQRQHTATPPIRFTHRLP